MEIADVVNVVNLLTMFYSFVLDSLNSSTWSKKTMEHFNYLCCT